MSPLSHLPSGRVWNTFTCPAGGDVPSQSPAELIPPSPCPAPKLAGRGAEDSGWVPKGLLPIPFGNAQLNKAPSPCRSRGGHSSGARGLGRSSSNPSPRQLWALMKDREIKEQLGQGQPLKVQEILMDIHIPYVVPLAARRLPEGKLRHRTWGLTTKLGRTQRHLKQFLLSKSAEVFVIKKYATTVLNSCKFEFISLKKNDQILARFGLSIWKYSAYCNFIQKSYFFFLKQELH